MTEALSTPQNVAAPRAYLEATPALELAAKHAGEWYAVIPRSFDGLVGPFRVGQALQAKELLQAVARATGTELTLAGDIPVFQSPDTSALKKTLAAMTSTDPQERRRGAFQLGQIQRLDVVAPLMKTLNDPDSSVRRAALLALGALEGDFQHSKWPGRMSLFELPDVPLDVDTLLWLAEEGAEPGGQEWRAAVSILARAREGQLPRSAWWNVWRKTPGTIAPTVWALGHCGDPDMRRPLEQILQRPATNVAGDRFLAAAAIGKIGSAESLRRYALPRSPHPDPEARCAAVYGLGFCRRTTTAGRSSETAADALRDLLEDPDPRVKELAVLSLGRLDTAGAVGLLIQLLIGEQADPALGAAAAQCLARSAHTEAHEALRTAAKCEDPAIRRGAAEALGELGGPATVETLDALLHDKQRYVVAAAGRALAAIGSDSAAPKLAALLTDSGTDLEVRIAVAIGLGQSRSPKAEPPLSEVALDPHADRRLREYAVRSLAMLADRAGQPTLRRLIEADPPVRMTLLPLRHLHLGDAAETTAYLQWWATHGGPRHEQAMASERIGELGTPEGTRFLAGGYNVFDNYTRWACIWPLVQNESTPVRRTLTELLTRSRRRTQRTNAAIALGGRGTAGSAPPDPDVVDALMAACEDPAESVRIAAADSLGLIGEPCAAPALIKLLEHGESVRVIHHALRSLRNRELAALPEARAALERVRGAPHDCGAPGGPSLVDQPANSFVLRRFPNDYDDLSLPNMTYESALSADGAGQIIQWGSHGRRYDTPQTGLTWVFDVKAGTWRRPAPTQEPPGICMTRGTVCDPIRGLVMATRVPTGMGGHGYVMYLRKFTAFSVPWVYDVAAGEWYAMRPAPHPGSAGYVASCFDWRNDAMLLVKNGMQVYDTHANTWTSLASESEPDEMHSCPPNAYDPVAGRLVVVIGADEQGRARTWAYDLPTNRWSDLDPADPPPALGNAPMVYDRANDVTLAFHRTGGETRVYAYHPRENRWESLPAAHPSPDYALFDAAYDPVNNVTVLCGGEDASCSGEPAVRETWTYRYKPANPDPAGSPAAPLMLSLDISDDAVVTLSWEPFHQLQDYHVYRGTGEHPWTAAFERITKTPLSANTFTDAKKLGPRVHYYQVRALGADGAERLCSNIVRTQPLPVRQVSVARAADGSTVLSWLPSAGPAVTGYNVYRAPAVPLDLWTEHFDPATNAGEFSKLNENLVEGTSFTCQADDIGEPGTETRWAPFGVYVVRAVNVLGVESGASPATLSIPGPPGPIRVVPTEDGARLVLCGPSRAKPLSGYHLYRLDCYRGDHVYRTRGAPHPGAVFVDRESWPAGDRQAYYVVPVDEAGQLGVPSSPGWGHDMP